MKGWLGDGVGGPFHRMYWLLTSESCCDCNGNRDSEWMGSATGPPY